MTRRSPTSTRSARRLDEVDYLVDEGTATALFFAPDPGPAAAARGRARRRQDRGGQGAGPSARRPADPAAVLRGADRQRGALRVELPAAAARDPARRVAARDARRRRPVHRGVPAGTPDPEGDPARRPDRRRCCSSTRSTAPTTSSRRCCSSSSASRRSPSPSSAPSPPTRRPVVVLTSNRSRELHDALRRRCLYHWIDFPTAARAAEILRRTVPAANEPLIASTTDFVGRVRALDLDKAPGMAETIDWVSALAALGVVRAGARRHRAHAQRDRQDPGRSDDDRRRARPAVG